MAAKNARPRTFRSAVAAWPEAMGAVQANPCDDTLGSLCTLLDVIDGEVCRYWETAGHDERMEALRDCRSDARHANRLVSDAAFARAQERGKASAAARAAKKEAEAA